MPVLAVGSWLQVQQVHFLEESFGFLEDSDAGAPWKHCQENRSTLDCSPNCGEVSLQSALTELEGLGHPQF